MNGDIGELKLGGKVTVKFTLASYLKQMEANELRKSENRRHVPTITELAKVAQVSRVAMSNIANGNRETVSVSILSSIMNLLRYQGFPVQIEDLFTVEELNDYPILDFEHVNQRTTGLVWIRPRIPAEEMEPPVDQEIREKIELAIETKNKDLEEDGRQFKVERRDIYKDVESDPLDQKSIIYNSVTLVTLTSLEEVEIGDYVHTSVIVAPPSTYIVEVNGMKLRKDTAHGFTAWCRIE